MYRIWRARVPLILYTFRGMLYDLVQLTTGMRGVKPRETVTDVSGSGVTSGSKVLTSIKERGYSFRCGADGRLSRS